MAVVRLSHAISQQFIQKKSGAIINLGSVVGLAPEFGLTLYGGSPNEAVSCLGYWEQSI